MSLPRLRLPPGLLLLVTILVAGTLLSWREISHADDSARRELRALTEQVGAAFDTRCLSELDEAPGKNRAATIERLQTQLRSIQSIIPGARRLSLHHRTDDGDIVLLADSTGNKDPEQLDEQDLATLIACFSRQAYTLDEAHPHGTKRLSISRTPLRSMQASSLSLAKPDEAKALVQSAVSFYRQHGRSRFLEEASLRNGLFHRNDLYAFVYDEGMTMLAHPVKPELIGRNQLAEKDWAGGTFFRREIQRVVQNEGRGWVQYEYLNPTNRQREPKVTYAEAIDNLIICSGAYTGLGSTVAVLSLETDAEVMEARIMAAALPPVLTTCVLLGLAGLWLLLRRRALAALPSEPTRGTWHTPLTVLSAGVILSIYWAAQARELDREKHREVFAQLATAQITALQTVLRSIEVNELESLVKFCENAPVMDRAAFEDFSAHLTRNPAVSAWEWIPQVKAENLEAFEKIARAHLGPSFQVWEKSADGNRVRPKGRPLLSPVLYIAPMAGNAEALGFDLSSEVTRAAALAQASETNLPTATAPIQLIQETQGQRSLLLLKPVRTQAGGLVAGHALAAIRMGSLARNCSSNGLMAVRIQHIAANGQTTQVAHFQELQGTQPVGLHLTLPVLGFGCTLAVTASGTSKFTESYPEGGSWAVLLLGLALTGTIATIFRLASTRRNELEQLVHQRTEALARSETSYRNQFAANTAIMLMLERDSGRIVDANDAALRFYGHPKHTLLSMRLHDLDAAPENETDSLLRTHRDRPGELLDARHKLADGSVRSLEVSASLIQFGGKNLIHAIIHDVTDRRRAESARLEMEQRLTYAMDASGDGLWDWRITTGEVHHNGRWCAMLGLEESFLRHKVDKFVERLHPDDLPAVMDRLGTSMRLGTPYLSRHRMVRVDGSVIWVQDRGKVVERDPNGNALRMVGAISDITDKQSAEEKLRTGETNLRALISAITDMILVSDDNGRILFANDSVSRILGFSQADLLCMRVIDLHPINKQEEAERLFREMISGTRDSCPLPMITRDLRTVAAETRVWKGVWNNTPCLFSITKDLSAEQEAQRRFEKLFRNNPVLLALTTYPERRYHDVNDAWTQALGYTREEVLGRTSDELGLFVDPDRARAVGDALKLRNRIVNLEVQVRTKQGSILDGMFSGEFIQSQGKTYLLTVMIDITSRKDAERQLLESNRQLEEASARARRASAAKSEFLANMSHEIRTPMNGVLGMLDLLLAGRLPDDERRFATVAKASGETLLNLLNDILDFSKIEARQLSLEHTPFDLHQLVRGCIQLLDQGASKKGLTFGCEIAPEVPALVRGDPGRLRQILINLTGNALKFTAAGQVAVRVSLRQANPKAALVHFSVSDSGIGIPAEKLGMLFTKFTQVDSSVTRHYGGTGLGLAICKQLAELMNGEIGVESTVGKGSTFWFTALLELDSKALPLPSSSGDEDSSVTGADIPLSAKARSARILVAEDHPVNQQVTSGLLQLLGLSAHLVANGLEALAALRDEDFDLVLMDVQMPELDGLEATRRIRSGQASVRSPDIPIVAMTAHAMQGDAEQCRAAGMDDYISKPVAPEALRRVLHKFLDKTEPGAEIQAQPTAASAAQPHAPAIFDKADLLRRLMGSEEFARAVALKFRETLPGQIQALKTRLQAGDTEGSSLAAHSLRGAAANMSGAALGELSAKLESVANTGDIAGARELLPDIEFNAECLLRALAETFELE